MGQADVKSTAQLDLQTRRRLCCIPPPNPTEGTGESTSLCETNQPKDKRVAFLTISTSLLIGLQTEVIYNKLVSTTSRTHGTFGSLDTYRVSVVGESALVVIW